MVSHLQRKHNDERCCASPNKAPIFHANHEELGGGTEKGREEAFRGRVDEGKKAGRWCARGRDGGREASPEELSFSGSRVSV